MPNNERNQEVRDAKGHQPDGQNEDKRTPSDDSEKGTTAGGGKQSSESEKDSEVSGQG